MNDRLLTEHGIFTLYPPRTRQKNTSALRIKEDRAILSEENILGTMENNTRYHCLYPNAVSNLQRYQPLLEKASKVYLSVRNYADWWNSAISFCITRGMRMPSQHSIDEIAKSKRGWPDVVHDVEKCFPSAEIIVREFSWKPENPKQHIRKLTDWPEISETNAEKRQHNRSPSATKLMESMADNRDLQNLDRLPVHGSLQLFTPEQVAALDEKYVEDVRRLVASDQITFWGNVETARQSIESRSDRLSKSGQSSEKPVLCFLHIGKTGSTRAKEALAAGNPETPHFLGSHEDTLVSTAQKFGRGRKLAFVFRHPEKRFVAAFCARLRQGRPHFDAPWSPAEAAAFSFFATPNDLAEALECDDERLVSAARYAFGNIVHMRRTYTHYLHSAAMVLDEHRRGNVAFCCEDSKFESHQSAFLNRFGSSHTEIKSDILLTTEEDVSKNPLSSLAKTNLKSFWCEDLEIYAACQKIAVELGFSEKPKSRLGLGLL